VSTGGSIRMSKRTILPPDLHSIAVASGSKSKSLKRYAETYEMAGRASAIWEIKTDQWFRKNWNQRKKWSGDLKAVADKLAKG
jgi:hypothetical protein